MWIRRNISHFNGIYFVVGVGLDRPFFCFFDNKCFFLKGRCPLRTPTRGAAPLTPAPRSVGQPMPDWVVKAGMYPRVAHADGREVKVCGALPP